MSATVPLRIALVTSFSDGFPALCLERMARAEDMTVSVVVLNEGLQAVTLGRGARMLRKARRIGVLGALNTARMRSWFVSEPARRVGASDIFTVAGRYGIPVVRTPSMNGLETQEALRRSGADIGVSAGNPIIRRQVFDIPPLGMINVHHELLPEFRGAQTAIWQLHFGSSQTGYTIHQIDDRLDTGAIIYREAIPIALRSSLRETIIESCAAVFAASAEGLVHALRNYAELVASASPQGAGSFYTAPTFRQYLQVRRQHRRLLKGARERAE